MPDYQRFYTQVGRRIREAREKRGLSQEALASLVSLTRTSVTNIEKGRQKFLAHTLVDLAFALRVEPATLLPESKITSEEELDELLKDRPPEEQHWIKAVFDSVEERE
ncbi:helix-turn-helix transcriptional regulator [Nostoc sp. CENA67]|uniref:Helix-turn-helix transcriptional regulator n=1 Tax=Amazonocrinis nigriterrae CENA67 TaxID=2794033 RepID=A0A8J7HZK0_9NOST|nr:helix-turn-helix transcriptional regulator [Amazonocrinis nigriterrae]MBH8567150.1 helix-turn-helix transcriptional regulator [Amazonocrinis nigriterrae CENA67]